LKLGRGWEALLITLSPLKMMSTVLKSEKVKIDGDDGLLGVQADHEEARWGKRVASISWGGTFPRNASSQASDESGDRRQRLWRMVVIQWKTIGTTPRAKKNGSTVK
jgi:hypothetical protein